MKRWHSCLLLLVLGLLGCDPSRVELSGEVTPDGQPLKEGSLLLLPGDGNRGIATGCAIEKGTYRLASQQAPTVGPYGVEIRASKKTGRMIQKALGQSGELVDEMVEAVAPRYNSKSTLTVDVKAGEHTADFAVFSK